jgi:RNA polymerase-binding transcription factor DksA
MEASEDGSSRSCRRLYPDFAPWMGRLAVAELLRANGSDCHFADEVDATQASESREIGFATRELLLNRVNHLSAALDQLYEGAYGICWECGEPISPARLHAMPEVQCCVRCQGQVERLGRRAW